MMSDQGGVLLAAFGLDRRTGLYGAIYWQSGCARECRFFPLSPLSFDALHLMNVCVADISGCRWVGDNMKIAFVFAPLAQATKFSIRALGNLLRKWPAALFRVCAFGASREIGAEERR